ncbi:MAG: pentapeptide MXKDX repeat protein [Chloroflexia bacterium]
MASNEGSVDVLVLNDQEGNWYAIPRDVVEQHRATAAQKAEIHKILGDDVSGSALTMGGNVLSGDAMRQDAMGQSAMGQSAMGQDAMRQDAMRQDAMRQDAMGQSAMGQQALQSTAHMAFFLSLPGRFLE